MSKEEIMKMNLKQLRSVAIKLVEKPGRLDMEVARQEQLNVVRETSPYG